MKNIIFLLATLFTFYELIRYWSYNPIFNLLLIPLVIPAINFIGFVIKTIYFKKLKEINALERQRHKPQKDHKKRGNKSASSKYYNEEVKPLYNDGKQLFSGLIKSRKMKRYQIIELKKLIDSRLGSNNTYYNKYNFKNDANEIYVKMKNYNLNHYDWEQIINYLKSIEDLNCNTKSI